MNELPRPSPDALLRDAERARRGRLKIFLGAAPGVGKTYAMLSAAHERRATGEDVVAGVIETHGRADTAALLRDLEITPPRILNHQGRTFQELDLDAVLKRRPALALIDELAHSNVPGSRHLKRHQDVDELLAAGINVYGTLNVQHLESLHDTVERITGVRVQERVPDRWFQAADEIELVDLPPDELIQRLRDGKVYVPEQAQRAIDRFFGVGNLIALRELALRVAAERVDSDVAEYLGRNPSTTPWPTGSALLVAVGVGSGESVVRSAARLAQARRLRWIAVHVINSHAAQASTESKDRLAATLRLAEQLGGEAVTIPGEDVATELLRYARSRNVTQLVVGRPARSLWRMVLRRSTLLRLLRDAQGYDVTVVDPAPDGTRRPVVERPSGEPLTRRAIAEALGVTLLATAISAVIDQLLPLANVSLLYLVGVLGIAMRHGRWPAYLTAFASFLCFNLLFTEPRFRVAVHMREEWLTLLFFLMVAMIAGGVASQVRGQMEALRKTARRTANLNEFSRRVARALTRDKVADAIVEHLVGTLDCAALVLTEHPDTRMRPLAREGISADYQFSETERAAAAWCWEQRQQSGASTSTLPTSRWLFVPLATVSGVAGVAGLQLSTRGRPLSSGQLRLLDGICDQAAVALERVRLSGELETSRVTAETEQLRSALLASVSHDLRTPLASIIGSASSLVEYDALLNPAQRVELGHTIVEEARRLDHHVQNLLDMIRLSQGRIEPALEWCDLQDVFAAARDAVLRAFPRLSLRWSGDANLPPLRADAALLRQVFVNLFENAARHAGPAAHIEVIAHDTREARVVRVQDDGPGIQEARRAQVFEPFSAVHDHRPSGGGLGLVICRSIVQLHRGEIRVVDLPRGGCCVEFTLPYAPAAGGAR